MDTQDVGAEMREMMGFASFGMQRPGMLLFFLFQIKLKFVAFGVVMNLLCSFPVYDSVTLPYRITLDGERNSG